MSTSTATETTTQQKVVVASADYSNMNVKPAIEDAVFQATARGDRNGTIKLPGIPAFTDLYEKRKWMKEHMAAAFRFFGKHGHGEGISGHISMRGECYLYINPILEDHFWMNPYAKHFSAMKASDLVLVDQDGYVTEGGNQAPINEAGFMIHSEIHKARPDVVAAAHTHGVYGKTWSAFGKGIEMITQDACNFYGKLGVYVDHGGIALAQEEGQQIAKALGEDKMACILQNHGLLTVGRTVDEAAFLLSSLDHACHSQLMAEAAAANGVPKKIINDEVAQYTANAVQTPHHFYTEFQPEFDLIVEETNGQVLL
ncbi:class II aldolase/adducin domain protein [Aspergillus flavus]|uniref:Class II aldolase/adducin domain protein n=1 Tax=Aspergillus flavus TaxID=5059 RepID=A0AB74BS91_ASPFL|nr:class II aldolase/adducin domain protein [Aspergillus flavus]RAQ65275.1 class II aldolase/adducin domain protein [Aspergillus flavus]RAQ77552.1 class II aldolase/adducin domain protein [Aspergillus flavus]RMZ35972.1 class II aldolase/adducin domain protein [Aspergillus flavus]